MKLTKSDRLTKNELGFTLLELMIVVAIIGVLSAIAYPSYQEYVKRTKRTDMMTELQNIASSISAQKLAKGNFTNIKPTDIGMKADGTMQYPRNDITLYNVTIKEINPKTKTLKDDKWEIVAVPIANTIMKDDGNLSIDFKGEKCHHTTPKKCGQDDAWRR